MKQIHKVGLIIFLILLADQWLKIYIKTHFAYGDSVLLLGQQWAQLHYVENEGMAFGITFDWPYGKLLLSLFRVLMIGGLFWYIRQLIAHRAPAAFVYCIALITAGAIGNMIDSAFYGMIFDVSGEQSYEVAKLVPFGQGYAPFMHGKVVDMFYFPITTFDFPEWLPGIGGSTYRFFSYIFNIADAAITTGILYIILFQRHFLKKEHPAPAETTTETPG